MVPYSLEDKVASGASLLDRECPGWADRINAEELDMASCADCVLGQVYGNYFSGLPMLNVRSGSMHGFDGSREDLGFLHELWLAEINARLTITNPEA